MNREEAIAIIRKEYLCVDRDCDIERNCGKCDLMMPSKEPILEAYKMAIKALEQMPVTTTAGEGGVIYYPQVEGVTPTVIDAGKQEPCEGCEYKLRGEVEQKTGYWEKATDGHCYWYKCSCCGTKAPKDEWGNDYFSPYCPECGARMIEPQERSDKE